MQAISMTHSLSHDVASYIENAAIQAETRKTHAIAYQLRLLCTLLRECPEEHTIVIDATFSANYVDDPV